MRKKKLRRIFILSESNISRRLPRLTIREISDFRQSGIFAHNKERFCSEMGKGHCDISSDFDNFCDSVEIAALNVFVLT